MWGVEPSTYVFPQEFLHIMSCDGGQGLNIYPFGEVINSNQQVFTFSFGKWKRAK